MKLTRVHGKMNSVALRLLLVNASMPARDAALQPALRREVYVGEYAAGGVKPAQDSFTFGRQ